MVEDYGGKDKLVESTNTPLIPPAQQQKSIQKATGAFMESIRTLPDLGPKLVDIVTAFGNVAHSYLMYENSGNERGNPPHQASRIEPYESLKISPDAQKNLNELLRYSILMEDPRGKSRRGNVVPRFYLRRYLIPHFHLTFSKRDSLQLENKQLETFLCDPEKFKGDAMRRLGINPDQESFF